MTRQIISLLIAVIAAAFIHGCGNENNEEVWKRIAFSLSNVADSREVNADKVKLLSEATPESLKTPMLYRVYADYNTSKTNPVIYGAWLGLSNDIDGIAIQPHHSEEVYYVPFTDDSRYRHESQTRGVIFTFQELILTDNPLSAILKSQDPSSTRFDCRAWLTKDGVKIGTGLGGAIDLHITVEPNDESVNEDLPE